MSDCSLPITPLAPRWSRRRLLAAAALLPVALYGCGMGLERRLRIGTNIWPGYEFLYAARDGGLFDSSAVKLVELLSATDVLQALAADTLEGGALTLDEVLTARTSGIDLTVIAVLDVSAGADALLVRPGIESLADLRGRRIALEQTAVGAVLLAVALERAGLVPADVRMIYRTVDRHVDAYRRGEVDAVVSFDPARSQLLAAGAVSLFDSREIPGRIVDVLAVRPRALRESSRAVRALVAGHFEMRQRFLSAPQQLAPQLASRLGLGADETLAIYTGLHLPDLRENHALLDGRPSRLEQTAVELSRVMQQAQLLPVAAPLEGLVDPRWLPPAEAG